VFVPLVAKLLIAAFALLAAAEFSVSVALLAPESVQPLLAAEPKYSPPIVRSDDR
jgi:hypothetical protein